MGSSQSSQSSFSTSGASTLSSEPSSPSSFEMPRPFCSDSRISSSLGWPFVHIARKRPYAQLRLAAKGPGGGARLVAKKGSSENEHEHVLNVRASASQTYQKRHGGRTQHI
eukprot:1386569-Pyramimonas_sp.AAC.1